MVQLCCHLVVGMEIINVLKILWIFWRKKCRGFSVHALEQFLYNIYRKAQNQEMPRTFSRIFTGSEKSVTKSKGFFTQTSRRRFPSNALPPSGDSIERMEHSLSSSSCGASCGVKKSACQTIVCACTNRNLPWSDSGAQKYFRVGECALS